MANAALTTTERHHLRPSGDRRSIEFLFETLLRPGNWAARLAYTLGLQGGVRASTLSLNLSRTGGAAADAASDTQPVRPPLRLAFAADFHAGGMTDDRVIAEACETLAAMRPDVLLLGGDFVSVRGADIDRLASRLADIPVPLGKFAVLGNHDLHADHARVVSGLEQAGVQLLVNRQAALPAPHEDIVICGLDDALAGEPRADLALDGAAGTRIVLMHSPDGLAAIGGRPFDLALCGHTHGGQIALPWGQPVIVPGGRLSRRYCRGRYCVDGDAQRTLLVSRGVGCSSLPVRLFATPEVHLCLIS